MSLKQEQKKLSPKIKVIVPKRVQDQFKYLCQEVSAVEWSGPLFYTVEGSINKPNSCVITLQEILPLDRGSAGYTTYDIGLPVVRFMHKNGAIENNWKIGHIHSHNSMSVFFSATDTSELTTNAANHNSYLSIIVNNKSEIIGKVGIVAKSNFPDLGEEVEDIGFVALDEQGEEYVIESVTKPAATKFFEYECDIVMETEEIQVTDEFKELMANMTAHQFSSREFPSKQSSYNRRSWEDDEDTSTGFQYTNKNQVVPHTNTSPARSSYVDENVEELAFQLIADEDTAALSMSKVEDIIDYYVAVDHDGVELAKSMLDRYDKVFIEIYKANARNTPKLYVLRTLIAHYKESFSMANLAAKTLMEPILAKLQAKYNSMSSISNTQTNA